MNQSISILSLSVAILGLALLTYWLNARLVRNLSRIRNSLDRTSWGSRLCSLFIVTLRCLPIGCVCLTAAWLKWANWRESGLAVFIGYWLFGVTTTLAIRVLEQRFPAPVAPDFQPRLVTEENCAEFGLTPEEVRGMIAGLMDAAKQAQSKDSEAGKQ